MRACGIAFLCSLVLASPLPAQAPVLDPPGVDVHVALSADGRAEVTERLHVGSDSMARRTGFQLLARPCADIGPVTISSASRSGTLRATSNDPWLQLVDSAGIVDPSSDVVLRYVVARPAGGRDIPLVVPKHPVVLPPGARGPRVRLRVSTPSSSDRITFPRLERVDGTREWRADLVAVPSFVSVRLESDAAAPCAEAATTQRDGGLSWRFWLLVSILVVWVPTYQWWARRQPEGDGEP